ncbi:hypothetical protein [Pleurocapsa sp. PCC 7327]|uniref:hypothetical protein n=1 Tax=Pleurocapsa sp. PCC 7327 TaxID=118163 RepID=UPI0002D7E1AE|nr:hypothetical protein [Pleurocapsa sp. PCC 7327]
MASELKTQPSQKPWWNRPLWGDKSLLEKLICKLSKPEVFEGAIHLHNRELLEAQGFSKMAKAIDSDKFGSQEFLLFVKIKYLLASNLDGYEGLSDSAQLLAVALKAKDSLMVLNQTELRYQTYKQQQFYKFVEDLLSQNLDIETFRGRVQAKLTELLVQIKTEEDKMALQAYVKELNDLSEHELGLKLLVSLKGYYCIDYSILSKIAAIINRLGKKDIQDLKRLVSLVLVNYEFFKKLKKIIGLSEEKNTPETYARLIQYLALNHKYQLAFLKFQELEAVLWQWCKHYQAILAIRQQYPPSQYKQPKDFSQEIPGLKIYLKYKNWLSDRKA